jgi:REP element-mobilizing transposase RayT
LPGDTRGFVGRVRDERADDPDTPARKEHDRAGTEYDQDVPGLRRSAEELMKGEPVWLTTEQAPAVRDQFLETARFRGWKLHAAAVMANHFHIVVAAPNDVLTDQLLRDFKSYASRALNSYWPRPQSGTWWTQSGSRRELPDVRAVENEIRYVLNQHQPLAVYPESEPERRASALRDSNTSEG